MQQKMKIFFLPLGEISVLYDDLVRPEKESQKSLKTAVIPTWAIYIEHPDAKVIFDTGMKYLPDKNIRNSNLQHQLSLCGVNPEEIDYVIMSHLHNDHAGGIELFPNAQIIVQRREFADALVESHAVNADGIYHREDVDINANWKLINGNHHLLKGIDLISLPGHTKGLQGMLLSLETTGKMFIVSDACYCSENYGPPIKLSNITVDDELSMSTIRMIRDIAEKNHAKIVFGHDHEQFDSLRKAPDFYD